MLNASRALARTVDLKIGWNRIGIVISLLIVSIAAVTLYNLLHDIQIDKVVSALREKSSRTWSSPASSLRRLRDTDVL